MPKGELGWLRTLDEAPLPKPIEKHTADSKWQYCCCEYCQRKRMKMEAMPGAKIDWDKLRLKDEKY